MWEQETIIGWKTGKDGKTCFSNGQQMIVYIKPWCPWCVEALAWLKARAITFESIDVLSNVEGASRMRKISGQSLTPTLEMPDGAVLADFDVRQLEAFLKGRGDS